jgi:tetratricopeptide (TPR) repeat protein
MLDNGWVAHVGTGQSHPQEIGAGMMILPGKQPIRQTQEGCVASPKRITVAISLLILFACAVVSPATAASTDEAAYTAGLQAVKAGDNSRAVTLFSQAIALNPNDYRYYNDRGIAYKVSGNLEKALEDYGRALAIKPNYPNTLNNRGLLLVQQGQYEKAMQDFSQALQYGGFEAKIHTNLGMALAGKGDHQAAVKEFQTAMSFRPMDPRSFLFMAQSLEKLGKNDQALKMYQVALGVVKDPTTEDLIEKRIAELEKDFPEANVSPRPSQVPVQLAKTSSPPPAPVQQPSRPVQVAEKRTRAHREIVRARTVAVPPAAPNHTRVTAPEPLPATLEELNRRSRSRALQKFSANAAEIFRQGLQFMDQADTKKALIRFEDTLQLERRNKNAVAVGWSSLQTGRAYLKIGDGVKASAHLENALKIFQRLKSGDEMILTLVDMAAVRKAAGQTDQASRLLSDAMREAATMKNPEVASALGDMAAGRTPAVAKRTAPVAGPAKTEGRAASAPPDSQTVVAQLDLVKRREAAPGTASQGKPAPSPAVAKEKAPEKPATTVVPAKADASPPQPGKGSLVWGRQTKAEPPAAATPPSPVKRVAEQKPLPLPEQPLKQPEKAVRVQRSVPITRPVPVETTVGGTPVAVIPAPRVQTPDNTKELGKKTGTGPAAIQSGHNVRPESIIPQTTPVKHKLTRQERYESATKRITEDLAELRKYKVAGDETSMIVVLERLARRYALRRQYDKALHGLTASLALREKLGLDGPAARLYDDRGVIRQNLGDRAGALEDLTRALVLAEAQGAPPKDTTALESRCGALAQGLGLDTAAALHAFRSLWKSRRSGDERGETDALHVIGKLYDNAQRPSEALNYYERSSASVLADKARIYEKLGKQKLAEQSYKEALDAFKRLDYSRYLVMQKKARADFPPPPRPRR